MSLIIKKKEIKNYVKRILNEAKKNSSKKDWRVLMAESIREKGTNLSLGTSVAKLVKIYENRQSIKFLKETLSSYKNPSTSVKLAILKEMMKIISEAQDASPHPNTGINVLESLLKKIVPIVEKDFKMLTTDRKQRDSFRNHLLNGLKNVLAGEDLGQKAEEDHFDLEYIEDPEFGKMTEGIEVEIDDVFDKSEDIDDKANDIVDNGKEDSEKFIDIDTVRKPYGQQRAQQQKDLEFNLFAVEGEEETGRNIAYETFKKIQTNVIDSYKTLGNSSDRKLFYDYLITNLKLYFDRFEEDLSMSMPEEPTTEEYEETKGEEMQDYQDSHENDENLDAIPEDSFEPNSENLETLDSSAK